MGARRRRKNKETAELDPQSPAGKYVAFRQRQSHENTLLHEFSQLLDFELDDFQIEACQSLEKNIDVLVAAPTASGKTIVGEFGAYLALSRQLRLFYTTPIKALSNQKYHDFSQRFGSENVGLLTGDNSINHEAPIIVMTTEVLRNMLYKNTPGPDLGYVVMDEVHYLADRFRGAVWEEVIIHLDSQVRLISLSATVSNAEDFGKWLSSIRSKTAVIVCEKRPVPLVQHMWLGKDFYDLYQEPRLVKSRKKKLRNQDLVPNITSSKPPVNSTHINPQLLAAQARSFRMHFKNNNRFTRIKVIKYLQNNALTPAIFFIFSRAGCDAALQEMLLEGLSLTSYDEQKIIQKEIEKVQNCVTPADWSVIGLNDWSQSLLNGFGAHHAGMLPIMKECVENLFNLGLIKIVFATETLSLGVNMPARTVVIEQLRKWDGSDHVLLTPGQYTQLTGRAGRRGKDKLGHALVMASPSATAQAVSALASKRTYPLRSSFHPTYNMAVNLLMHASIEQAHEVMEKSFAQWEANKSVLSLRGKLSRLQALANDQVESNLCSRGDVGELGDLMLELSRLEKHAQLARKQGVEEHLRRQDLLRIDQLRKEIKTHRVFSCPRREEHLRNGLRSRRNRGDIKKLETEIQLRLSGLSTHLDRIIKVLEHLNYVDKNGVLKSKGELLSAIYSERDLCIAQCLYSGVFNGLSSPELAGVLSALLYEPRNSNASVSFIPAGLPTSVRIAIEAMDWRNNEIQKLESEYLLPLSSDIDAGLAPVVYQWARGKSLAEVLKLTDIPPGDFVRYCRQIIDLASQISRINYSKSLNETISKLILSLRREVVAWQD